MSEEEACDCIRGLLFDSGRELIEESIGQQLAHEQAQYLRTQIVNLAQAGFSDWKSFVSMTSEGKSSDDDKDGAPGRWVMSSVSNRGMVQSRPGQKKKR